MMLGFQGTSSPSKTYRCPACSATFTGLASLLVHQATHASAMPKVPTPVPPNAGVHETQLSSVDLPDEQPPTTTHPPESSSPSFFICDCGEEFREFNLLLEHKRSHFSEGEPKQSQGDNGSALGTHSEISQAASQASDPVVSPPSTSRPSAAELPAVAGDKPDVSSEDGITMETAAQEQHTPPQGVTEKQLENTPPATETPPESAADEDNNSGPSSEKGGNLPSKNYVMKLVASAYMKRFTSPPYVENDDTESDNVQNDDVENSATSDDVSPETKPEAARPINDLSIAQLRRLLSKPDIKTKAPSINKVLDSSKKNVVSLTKILSPVVVLETRQKLRDPNGNCTYGSYQCGRCRRVFDNLDKLTEHHFLHKKERIKCCRRCKQLIIGRMPLPDKHICPQLGKKALQLSKLRNKVQFSQKLVPFHSLSNTRKVFFCPLCKHSYARRWNLKNHKCQGSGSSVPLHVSSSIQNMLAGRSPSNEQNNVDDLFNSQTSKSVGVGPELTSAIKLESISPRVNQSSPSLLPWAKSAKRFSPFYPKSRSLENQEDVPLSEVSLSKGEESGGWDASPDDDEDDREGQWTMPLDDETEVHSSLEKTANGIEPRQGPEETASPKLSYFIKEGVKRYPCNGCQKTYSRASTLSRHLRLCGFWPRGVIPLSGGQGAPLSAGNPKPMFSCYVCGRNFNRKDNMMTHRARCQLKHASANADAARTPGNGPAQENDGSNWGIMSLPSVLPRRVTCECGVGFTSPRLLLEHLQKHAQESYTCPTCGETVGSWADYEVHLHIHMHPHHQLLKGLQPQRSHPLLIRFQQQRPHPPPPPPPQQQQQQQPQLVHQPAQDQTIKADPPPNPVRKQQRAACARCGNTFATRCSLRRHLAWNRCKGLRVTNPSTNPPKTYHCSHCNSNFPNATSLLFHQRSGACKPAIKPVRCPVCLRWFGTVDGLQKHLLTHKQS